jgi:hypothetical protein
LPRTLSGERSLQGPPSDQRQYQARRPTNDQVRDFLQLRQGDADRQSGSDADRSFRGGGNQGESASERVGGFTRRGDEGQRDGRGLSDRDFGDRDGDRRDFGDRTLGDRGSRDGDFGDRDRGDREDRDYQRWRDTANNGDRGKVRDHRDWSGKWREGDRFDSAHRIREHWRHDRDRDDYPFHDRWWGRDDHRHHHWHFWGDYASRHHRPYYWWTWSSAPRLTSWIGFGWPTYYYWDYGPGEYIYYDDGVVYVNGRWYAPAPVYHERTVQLVERAPDLTPEEAAQLEWMPLGVFAVTRDGVAEPDVLVQLAVTKDGVIGGTAYNQHNAESYPVEGIVEKDTQRAVWSYADAGGKRVVMETSIFNLTQPEATGLVHYGPEDIEVIQLVRLE